MELNDEVLSALLQAVEISPESAALRRHYAEILLNRGYTREAEVEFRKALDLDDADAATKLGLARSLHAQGQDSNALLLVRQVMRRADRPAKAYVLYARLLLALGSVKEAVAEYNKAIETDPKASDPELESRLSAKDESLIEDGSGPELPVGAEKESPGPEAEEPRKPAPTGRETSSLADEGVLRKTVQQLFSARPAMSFRQVGGLSRIKHELEQRLIEPSRRPGSRRPSARVLLFGPPGCGKTHLARALAGEILASFLVIGLRDLRAVWRDQGARVLREICAQARQEEAVLVLEQIDQEEGDLQLVREIVDELEEHGKTRQEGIVLLTTSQPWKAMPGLLQPGRYDHVLFVQPPSASERAEILKILCAGKPQHFLSYSRVAEGTRGFSAADLRSLVDGAVRQRLQQSLEEGRPLPLTTEGLIEAAASVPPSVPAWREAAAEHLAALAKIPALADPLRHYLEGET